MLINSYRFGAPPLWTPSSLTTALWVDAADPATVTLDGANVTQWADKSGNTRNLSSGSGVPSLLTATLNGKDVISFVGQQNLQAPVGAWYNSLHNSPSTTFLVCRITEATGRVSIMGTPGPGAPGPQWMFWRAEWDDIRLNVFDGNAQDVVLVYIYPAASQIANNTWFLSRIALDPQQSVASNRGTLSVNGGSIPQNEPNFNTRAASTSNAIFPFTLGASYANTGIQVAEAIIATSMLQETDMQKAEGYLSHKWGLASLLPSNHPYKNAAPLANA